MIKRNWQCEKNVIQIFLIPIFLIIFDWLEKKSFEITSKQAYNLFSFQITVFSNLSFKKSNAVLRRNSFIQWNRRYDKSGKSNR